MLFYYNNKLVSVTKLERSFRIASPSNVFPCIIIHFEYVGYWDWEGSIEVFPESPYWEMFLYLLRCPVPPTYLEQV